MHIMIYSIKTQIHHNQTIWKVQGERKYLAIIKIKLLSNQSLELFIVIYWLSPPAQCKTILFVNMKDVQETIFLMPRNTIQILNLIYNCFKVVSYEKLWYRWDLTYLEYQCKLFAKSLDSYIILLCFLIISVNLGSLFICISYLCWSSHLIFF